MLCKAACRPDHDAKCLPRSLSERLGEKSAFWGLPPAPKSSEQHLCSLSTHGSKGLPYFASAAPHIQAGSKTLEHKAENICYFFSAKPTSRREVSRASLPRQRGCAIPGAAAHCRTNKAWIIWPPTSDFASSPAGKGMPGSLEVQQQINPVALTPFPLSGCRCKICGYKHHGKKIKEACCPVS